MRNGYQNNQNASTTINLKYARSKKPFLYLLLLPHILSASVIAFSKKNDGRFIQLCVLFTKKFFVKNWQT